MSEPLILTEAVIDQIAEKVAARVNGSALPIDQIAVSVDELQVILGCKSRSATYREIADLGLKPYRQGKYRRADAVNAVARRTRK